MKKYFIITFGCQMNWSDSERIASVLDASGLRSAPKMEEADLVVINACSVRQAAFDRIFGILKKAKKKLLLTGCVLEKDRKRLQQKFDFILKIDDLLLWPKILEIGKDAKMDYLKVFPKSKSQLSALIPIMTGCNNFCSYCAVPYTRGRERSRTPQEIINEAKCFIKNGAKEIWLLGQNVNSYKSLTIDFSSLLRRIEKIPGNFWIRFTSPHPKDFSDKLIETMANSKKIAPSLNLPLQSGDNTILKKMNRPYTKKQYLDLVKRIREKIPGITLSTDVIVGFPTEKRTHFQNTLDVFEKVGFDMAYISEYSPRPETRAFQMKDDVLKEEKGRRKNQLNELLKKTSLRNNLKFLGKEVMVLTESYKNGYLFGRSFEYKPVKFKGQKKLLNQFVKVKIISASPWNLKGEKL